VTSYRLYRLDGAGKITNAEWIEADEDAAAVEQVRALKRKGMCELWDRNRLVAVVDPPKGGTDA
jgi:hypothetical protein